MQKQDKMLGFFFFFFFLINFDWKFCGLKVQVVESTKTNCLVWLYVALCLCLLPIPLCPSIPKTFTILFILNYYFYPFPYHLSLNQILNPDPPPWDPTSSPARHPVSASYTICNSSSTLLPHIVLAFTPGLLLKVSKTRILGMGFYILIRNVSFSSLIYMRSHNSPHLGTQHSCYHSVPCLALTPSKSLLIDIVLLGFFSSSITKSFPLSYKKCFVPLSNRCDVRSNIVFFSLCFKFLLSRIK